MTPRDWLPFYEAVAWPLVDPGAFGRAESGLPRGPPPALVARLALHPGRPDAGVLTQAEWARHSRVLGLLEAQAEALLEADGAVAVLRPPDPVPGRLPMAPGEEILRWRAASFYLPPVLLLPFLRRPDPPGRVRVLDAGLRPAGPVVEPHLHRAAAYRFDDLWEGLAAAVDGGRSIRVRRAPEGFTPEAWCWMLDAALHARPAFLDGRASAATEWLAEGGPGPTRRGEVAPWRREVVERLRRRARQREGCELEREVDVLSAGLEHAAGQSQEVAFVQYLRVLTLAYQHVTMRPTRRGLEDFDAALDCAKELTDAVEPPRRGVARPAACAGRPQHADDWPLAGTGALVRAVQADLDLGGVELRIGPPRRLRELETRISEANQLGLPTALVCHFIRAVRSPRRDASPADQRWQVWRDAERAVERMLRWIRWKPSILESVRGVDVASQERRGPLWLLRPALSRLRAASRAGPELAGAAPLRQTLHVGEDFLHLLSGLRAIHEPFRMGIVRRGDRLGHALALGVDPHRRAPAHRCVRLSRWDRICDLAWAVEVVESQRLPADAAVSGATRHELRGHAEALGAPVADLFALPALLADPAVVDLARSAGVRPQRPGLGLVRDWMFGLRPALEDLVEADEVADLPLTALLSTWLRRHLAGWQVVIESNPSSNFLVAALDGPAALPAFASLPVDPAEASLAVTIGSDDPVVFSTTLADEYAYAWATLVHGLDKPASYARAFLDAAAATGWRTRFIPRASDPSVRGG